MNKEFVYLVIPMLSFNAFSMGNSRESNTKSLRKKILDIIKINFYLDCCKRKKKSLKFVIGKKSTLYS